MIPFGLFLLAYLSSYEGKATLHKIADLISPNSPANKIRACIDGGLASNLSYLESQSGCVIKISAETYSQNREEALQICYDNWTLMQDITTPAILKTLCAENIEKLIETGTLK